MCSPWPSRRWGGAGWRRWCCHCGRGNRRQPAHGVHAAKPSCSRLARPCKPRLRRTRCPRSGRRRDVRMGQRGRRSVPRPCSGPQRPSKVATALCLRCITIIGVYRSAATRSGPCCITSLVARRMGQRPPHGFSDGHVPTSLRPCSLRLATCPGLATAIRPCR